MPYGKYKSRKRYRTRRKGKRKVYKAGIPLKALTGRIDTRLEFAMQKIARRVHNQSIVRLIDRNYLWGGCDPLTNAWNFSSLVGAPKRIYYDGIVKRVAMIDKIDINMPLNAPNVPDEDEPAPQMEQDNDGAIQGMTTETLNGRRSSDMVTVQGFTIHIKVWQPRLPAETQLQYAPGPNQVGAAHYRSFFDRQAGGGQIQQLYETVILRYGLYQVFDDQAGLPEIQQLEPSVQQLIPIHSWGYSSSLDVREKDFTLLVKKRTLYKGQVTLNLRQDLNKEKTIKVYVKLKKPLKLQWDPVDQNGVQAVSSRLFFAMRSNIPQLAGLQLIDHSCFAPLTAVVFKTHYQDS